MVTIQVEQLAGEAYGGEYVARFYTPRVVTPYDTTGANVESLDARVRYGVTARQYFKPHK
jgi:hypothetical protein